MNLMGKVAVVGSGSWATALAKLLLKNCNRICWFIPRRDRIDDFLEMGHNPAYLTDVEFDTDRIFFSDDINEVMGRVDTAVIAIPSPYMREPLEKISVDISRKNIVSAVKGIVPGTGMIPSDWMISRFGCRLENMLVIGGPCHAEEVALDRLSYLTIGCHDLEKSRAFASLLAGKRLKTIISQDLEGIEYGAVLKNVYAIAAGIIHGIKAGDNFKAMTVSNAAREMHRFIDAMAPMPHRDIDRSAYLGDLLVTAYSRFSRNHNFGAMIGKGYSVKAATMEMEMVAEGYFATKCIHDINEAGPDVHMPIMNAVYSVLYDGKRARTAIEQIADSFR